MINLCRECGKYIDLRGVNIDGGTFRCDACLSKEIKYKWEHISKGNMAKWCKMNDAPTLEEVIESIWAKDINNLTGLEGIDL